MTQTCHYSKLTVEHLFMQSPYPALNTTKMGWYTLSPSPTHSPKAGTNQFFISEWKKPMHSQS